MSLTAPDRNGLSGGSGTLAEVLFTALPNSSGISPLTLSSVRLNDTYGRDFATSALQADITILNGNLRTRNLNLADAIAILQILAGAVNIPALPDNLAGEEKLGIEDVMYILRHVSQ
jgi:hypothetical protein